MTTFSDVQHRLATWRTQEPSVRPPDIYVGLVIAAGMGLLLESVYALAIRPPDLGWALLVLLSIGSAQLMLRMPAVPISFSVSDIFTFTAALMYGPAAGALAAAIDAAVLSTRLVSSGRSTTRYLFNVSAVTLAMWVAACWFFLLSGTTALAADPAAIISHVGSLAAFALLYFALNTGLVAAAIALATRRSLWQVWCAHFLSLWPGYVGGAAASGLALFLFSTRHGDFRVLAFVLPMPFILYITFKTSIARMQDDVAHLTRINSIYLSTIEALAQAVDARDEVTHGHIRRVQKNADAARSRAGGPGRTRTAGDRGRGVVARYRQIGDSRAHPEQAGQADPVRIRDDEAARAISAPTSCRRSSSRFRSCPSCVITTRAGMETAIPTGCAASRFRSAPGFSPSSTASTR